MPRKIPYLRADNGDQYMIEKAGLHTIGSTNCSITLSGDTIEPLHAALISLGERVMLRPEQGVTMVNGQPIKGMISLKAGDKIQLGSLIFHLAFEVQTQTPATPAVTDAFKLPDDGLITSSPTDILPTLVEENDNFTRANRIVSLPVEPEADDEQVAAQPDGELPGFASHDEAKEASEENSNSVFPASIPSVTRTNTDTEVNFLAYYPHEIAAQRVGGLYVYAFIPDAREEIADDIQQFIEHLGGQIRHPKKAPETTQLRDGTPLTVTIECQELAFSPMNQTKRWQDEWVRFDFDFTAPDELIGQIVKATVSIQIEGIEVASIRECAIEIVTDIPQTVSVTSNPLAHAKLQMMAQKQVGIYQRIFVSYSRKDKTIVEAYRFAQQALGNEIFIDTYSIRSGENWQAALAYAIDHADILQLFWSVNSAQSENVAYEWDYALNYRCAGNDGSGFIRPICWRQPMPPPPPPLSHLNFRFIQLAIPELDDDESTAP